MTPKDRGRILRRLRDAKGLTQKQAGDRIGVSESSISYWEGGVTTPKMDNLKKLAYLYGVNPSLLVDGIDKSEQLEPTKGIRGKVPLISWVRAGEWQGVVDMYHPGDGEDWIETVTNTGANAFALRVKGDSMEPEFVNGDIIIVDPSRSAEHGSFVVVRMDQEAEATFKQLVIDGGATYLRPLNPRYPILRVNSEATIVGVIVSKTKVY